MIKAKRIFRGEIEIDKIRSSPFQPRLEFDLEDLRETVKRNGILIPLTVREIDGYYELIDGERRWRLAKELEYKTVVCDVVEATDEQADDWIWELNESRKPYEPKERALRYRRFREKGMILKNIAEKHKVSQPIVRAYLGVFKLPLEYQELVWSKELGIAVILQILPLLNEKKEKLFFQAIKILDKAKADCHYGWRKTEEDVEKLNEQTKQAGKKIAETIVETKIETPEDLDKAARLLKQEAKKKREAELIPEQKAEMKAEKERKEKERKLKAQERQEEKKRKVEEKERREDERADKKAKKIKSEDLLADPDHLKRAHREYQKLVKKVKKDQLDTLIEEVESARNVEVKAKGKVHLGEWWQLGQHSLYCGDTSKTSFYNKLPDSRFAFADPPYNEDLDEWDRDFKWQHDWLENKADIVAVTPGIGHLDAFFRLITMEYKWSIACWLDNGITRGKMGFGNWIYISLFSKGSVAANSQDFVRVSIEGKSRAHKGQKPIKLIVWLLDKFTLAKDIVIDPFLGSGTTLLACESLDRVCCGGEINPIYCSEIIDRWEEMTKRTARRYSGDPN